MGNNRIEFNPAIKATNDIAFGFSSGNGVSFKKLLKSTPLLQYTGGHPSSGVSASSGTGTASTGIDAN